MNLKPAVMDGLTVTAWLPMVSKYQAKYIFSGLVKSESVIVFQVVSPRVVVVGTRFKGKLIGIENERLGVEVNSISPTERALVRMFQRLITLKKSSFSSTLLAEPMSRQSKSARREGPPAGIQSPLDLNSTKVQFIVVTSARPCVTINSKFNFVIVASTAVSDWLERRRVGDQRTGCSSCTKFQTLIVGTVETVDLMTDS